MRQISCISVIHGVLFCGKLLKLCKNSFNREITHHRSLMFYTWKDVLTSTDGQVFTCCSSKPTEVKERPQRMHFLLPGIKLCLHNILSRPHNRFYWEFCSSQGQSKKKIIIISCSSLMSYAGNPGRPQEEDLHLILSPVIFAPSSPHILPPSLPLHTPSL